MQVSLFSSVHLNRFYSSIENKCFKPGYCTLHGQDQMVKCTFIVCRHPRCTVLGLVHKRMFYNRTNLRMLQHSNVECNIRMFILPNKMMYFGDFVVLAA